MRPSPGHRKVLAAQPTRPMLAGVRDQDLPTSSSFNHFHYIYIYIYPAAPSKPFLRDTVLRRCHPFAGRGPSLFVVFVLCVVLLCCQHAHAHKRIYHSFPLLLALQVGLLLLSCFFFADLEPHLCADRSSSSGPAQHPSSVPGAVPWSEIRGKAPNKQM